MNVVAWSESGERIVRLRRLDAEYFDPRVAAVTAELLSRGSRKLDEFVTGAWRGAVPEYDPEGTCQVVKTANIKRFEISAAPVEYVAEDRVELSSTIPSGSLLITSTGVGSAGRSFAYFGDDKLVADGHVAVLPLKCDPVDGAYICAFLQSPVGRQQMIGLHRGSSRQIEIYPDDLLTLPILWPALSVRQNIGQQWLAAVRSVEASRSCVSTAVAAIEDYVALRQGEFDLISEEPWQIMRDGLSQRLRLDPEYGAPKITALRQSLAEAGAMRMSDLVIEADTGLQPEFYDPDGDVLVVKSKDVNYPEFYLDGCDRTFGDYPRYLEPGDALVNMTGEGSLGRAGVVPEFEPSSTNAIVSVDVAFARVDRRMVVPQFLALFLNSWMGLYQTQSLKTGSSRQQHLYPAHFTEVMVPLRRESDGTPDIGWQTEIVKVAEERSVASQMATRTGEKLDEWFVQDVAVPVDLTTIPR
jgi:type I restriction enzyme S subunit